MRILWSELAHEAYLHICDSINGHFGRRTESEYKVAVDKAVKQIAKHPNLGNPEYELAADGSVRSKLVNGLSKIIYYKEDDTLYIADVWATRQDPSMLVDRFGK